MIGFIKGEAVSFTENGVILENNGIGYEISVSSGTIEKIKKDGATTCLHTYLSVRDDGLFLYGFYTKEEKNMFLKLITINGVGPKAALGILSGIELDELMSAIMSSDIKRLSKIKGVGKKTAERIVLELRGSIDADSAELLQSLPVSGSNAPIDKEAADAISALRGLGFTQSEATDAVMRAKPLAKSAEELVTLALRSF